MTDILELGKRRAIESGLILRNGSNLYNEFRWYDQLLYYAEDIHELLGKGVEAFSSAQQSWTVKKYTYDKTQGLLIGIRPIARPDTAESLLNEVIGLMDLCGAHRSSEKLHAIVDRARKLQK